MPPSSEDARVCLAAARSELKARDRRIEQILRQLNDVSAQKGALERVLAEITSSTSWRLTAPYRYTKSALRGLFPLVRTRRYELVPHAGHHMTLDEGQFHSTGEGATLELQVKGIGIPSGWVLARVRVECAASHMFFWLFYSTGRGFDSHQRVPLLLQSGQTTTHLVRLPPGVDGFRLDPFDGRQPFALPTCSIQEAGSIQALAFAGRRHGLKASSSPRVLAAQLRKALAIVRAGGIAALKVRMFANSEAAENYHEWVRAFDTLSNEDRTAIRAAIDRLPRRPLISVVMPTYNTPEPWLRRAIESVRAQLYQDWELCIADDASTDPRVRQLLDEYAAADTRIKVAYRSENGHISAASNSALDLAVGEYIALLDHDDELTEHALYMVADEITRHPDAMLIYSDEDKKTSYDMRFNPYFKSDWNPDLLLSQNYVCHLSVYRTALVRQLGGFRKGFEGAQDWDLLLRATDAVPASTIRHIPHVLYHWRVIEGSTAQSTAFKPYVMEAQRAAVTDHLRRHGVEARVEIQESISQLRVHFPVPSPQPLVSLIIPTRDGVDFLERCVSSILNARSCYSNYEIVIVDNGSEERRTFEFFETLTDPRVRVVQDCRPFNFSRINNLAAKSARGSILGFLNNDLEVITGEWLSEMVSQASRPEVGAVGARLLYPNDLVQHAGIILGIGGVAGHNHKGITRHDPGQFNRAILLQELSAVTAACLLMRRDVFDEVGGFDEDLEIAFNDVDLCLRVGAAGYRVVYTPYAELYHHESASRGYENTPDKVLRFERECAAMKKRWGARLWTDPYYSPNLTLITEDFKFAFPPRAVKPWLRPVSTAPSFSNTEAPAEGHPEFAGRSADNRIEFSVKPITSGHNT